MKLLDKKLPPPSPKVLLIETFDTKVKFEKEPSRELYDVVSSMRWNRAVRQCQDSPLDAYFQDSETLETPLHIACRNRPGAWFVHALLKAYPDAVRVKSSNGELPLHLACRHNASIEVLRGLVKAYPGTASISTKHGKTPIRALWEGRDKIERKANYSSLFWQHVQVILEAVARHRQGSYQQPVGTLFVLHAALSLEDCPEGVLRYVFHKYPEHIEMRDDLGQLPLHVAVLTPPQKVASQQLFKKSRFRGESQGAYICLAARADRDIARRLELVITILLDRYPQAAREHDPNEHPDRYPIHTAILHKHQWYGGVRELFKAAPEAVEVVDPVYNLYPFQLASALLPGRQETADLDSIYKLLRVLPSTMLDVVHVTRQEIKSNEDSKAKSDPLERENLSAEKRSHPATEDITRAMSQQIVAAAVVDAKAKATFKCDLRAQKPLSARCLAEIATPEEVDRGTQREIEREAKEQEKSKAQEHERSKAEAQAKALEARLLAKKLSQTAALENVDQRQNLEKAAMAKRDIELEQKAISDTREQRRLAARLAAEKRLQLTIVGEADHPKQQDIAEAAKMKVQAKTRGGDLGVQNRRTFEVGRKKIEQEGKARANTRAKSDLRKQQRIAAEIEQKERRGITKPNHETEIARQKIEQLANAGVEAKDKNGAEFVPQKMEQQAKERTVARVMQQAEFVLQKIEQKAKARVEASGAKVESLAAKNREREMQDKVMAMGEAETEQQCFAAEIKLQAKAGKDAKEEQERLANKVAQQQIQDEAKARAVAKAEQARLAAEMTRQKIEVEAKAREGGKAKAEPLAAKIWEKEMEEEEMVMGEVEANQERLAAEIKRQKIEEEAKVGEEAKAKTERLAAKIWEKEMEEKVMAMGEAEADQERLVAGIRRQKIEEEGKAGEGAKDEQERLVDKVAQQQIEEAATARAVAEAEQARLTAEIKRQEIEEEARAEAETKSDLLSHNLLTTAECSTQSTSLHKDHHSPTSNYLGSICGNGLYIIEEEKQEFELESNEILYSLDNTFTPKIDTPCLLQDCGLDILQDEKQEFEPDFIDQHHPLDKRVATRNWRARKSLGFSNAVDRRPWRIDAQASRASASRFSAAWSAAFGDTLVLGSYPDVMPSLLLQSGETCHS